MVATAASCLSEASIQRPAVAHAAGRWRQQDLRPEKPADAISRARIKPDRIAMRSPSDGDPRASCCRCGAMLAQGAVQTAYVSLSSRREDA